ncbi:hypothetical protein [Pseudoduganella namucuonensis]|uniref:Cytochrome C and Quinol oxidase polypeptide I n=1 Tax=Pseudoduganella namucuonensis TaxID=1035707 RepID=A0A1I7FKH1_9BURK|nr:hypothetical protein [Pseudoduganella namucuonensis]SFU36702.1 hypothetical protein SAMN05216552_1002108 [Pseudoduganella namucuonensis]
MSAVFVKTGVVYLVLGLMAGGVMHHQHHAGLLPLHAYLSAIGGLSIVFGLIYRTFPRAGRDRLAFWHFWLFNIPMGLIFLYMSWAVGAGRTFDDTQPHTNDMKLGVLALVLVVSVCVFVVNVFKNVTDAINE